ncbi:hypothetical protein [Tenacibaculum sp. UWU-22]|uniref:hypothetical protein n=1 Tax=Tenacibaculum sp. UWU-22 TaxID=3234187 RepID=UPI0034DB471F
MKKKLFFYLILVSATIPAFSQVKIGDNPSSIHLNSILELESSDKVLVISRMNNTQMNAIHPLEGALVFNTDENCVFMFDNTSWKSLCGEGVNVTTSSTAPTHNNLGDFWINNTKNNAFSLWDGTNWIAIDNNPRRGNGAPTNTTAPNPTAGDIYADSTTGLIYAYNGSAWIATNSNLSANNGLLIDSNNTIQLGGLLIQPTTIETNGTNTLAITGLENGDSATNDVVTIDKTSGVLKKTSVSNLLREDVTKIIAANGQVTFTDLTLHATDKINVYRNGVRVDFTINNPHSITLEPAATCYAGDEIRIIQLY